MSALPAELQAAIITAALVLQLAAIAACLFMAYRLNNDGPKRNGADQ